MKSLQTYLIEAIKPPRLSAKNRELWANNKPLDEEEVMKWIKENTLTNGDVIINDDMVDIKGSVEIFDDIREYPFPFGTIYDNFYFGSALRTLKNFSKVVKGDVVYDISFHQHHISLQDVKKVCKISGTIRSI